MRVRAKITGERQIATPDGFWGVTFRKGETLTIPEQAFHPELFTNLEKPAPSKIEGLKKAES